MDTQGVDTQRVLWGVVAVSLLVIVVLAGGLYFLRPQGPQERVIMVTHADGSTFDPFEYVRNDRETPGLQEATPPVHQITLVVGESESPMPAPATVPETSPAASVPAPPVHAPTPTVGPAAGVGTAPAPESVARLRTTVAAASRSSDGLFQYWIQVGSFSSRSRADDLQRLVDQLGYTGRITTHEAEGVILYRVRIGPYASRQEADRLLGKLRSANDMDGWIARVSD